MGNSLTCACFGTTPSSALHPERSMNDGDNALTKIVERALVVDVVDAPALLHDNEKSRQFTIRTANVHRLTQLPLRTIKQIVLQCIRRYDSGQTLSRADTAERDGDTDNSVITVVTPQRLAGIRLSITSTTDGAASAEPPRCIIVQFATAASHAVTTLAHVAAVGRGDNDARFGLQLQQCAYCGATDGCSCGWRSVHSLSAGDEKFSLLEVINAKLLRAPGALRPAVSSACYRLRFTERTQSPVYLEATIVKKKIVHPMIERPYAVYTIEVCHSALHWEVTRRFQDFAQLHVRLTDAMHARRLPELPRTKWVGSLNDAFLLERHVALNSYLQRVLLVDTAQTSVPLLSFLGALSTTSVDHEALTLQRRDVLHLRVLTYYAAPGDLILFRCCGPVSGIQRSITGSEWDHVGVVVPGTTSTSLHLLEATGDGVSSFPLRSLVTRIAESALLAAAITQQTSRLAAYAAFHIHYIALRRLQTPLLTPSVRCELLRRFACEVEGRPYGLSVGKLLRTASSSEMCANDFFCSELAAEAFKALGVIHSSIPSSNFWPGSFTTGGVVDAELARRGAALAPEVLVDCRLLEVAMATSACGGDSR